MSKLEQLNIKKNIKAKQYNDTPTSSWRKELFKLELSLIQGKIELEEWKVKNK